MPFPPLRPFARGDVRAQTAAEAAAFDDRAISETGVPQAVLMENAGRAAAAVLDRLYPVGTVVGLVGSGNNGGDALVALRTLSSWGRHVKAVLVADRSPNDPLLHGWPVDVVTDDGFEAGDWAAVFSQGDVVIDGLLGTGAHGAPRERVASAIEYINQHGRVVMSLDVPSGIDATTGAVPGAVVDADVTVAFGAPKVGALTPPGRAHVGRHIAVEIGFPPAREADAGAVVVTPDWARARHPERSADAHKNQVGRVLIIGGRVGMAGAVILAVRSAFRSGAGLVRVCSLAANREALQTAVPEAIFVDASDEASVQDAVAKSDAIVAGPGLGADDLAAGQLTHVLEQSHQPLLLDADALNLAARGSVDLRGLASSRPLLITPHPGEMGRLMGDGAEGTTRSGRLDTVRHAAERFGCAVLLKGAPSLVAAPGLRVHIDSQGSSDLAVAGMGDTLAGVCGTLMAQGLDPASAGSVGLYLSGRASRLAGRAAGLTPSDVVRWLPDALSESGSSHTDLGLPFVTFDADPPR